MELPEFMLKLRETVTKFENNYREGQRTQPNMYPTDLPEGDWYEQFDAFQGIEY